MEFTLRAIELLIAGALNLLLAGFLFWKYRKRRTARILGTTILFMAGYCWLTAGLAAATSVEAASLWYQYLMPASYFLVVSLFHFSVVFSHSESGWTRQYRRFAYFFAGALSVLRVLKLDGGSLEFREGQGWFPASNPLYTKAYIPFVYLTVLWGLILVIRRMVKTPLPSQRNKLGFFFMALGSAIFFDTFNIVPALSYLAPFSTVAYSGILAYAITRHRLFDLSLAVSKGALAVALAFSLVVGAGILLLKLQEQVVLSHTGFSAFGLASTALLLAAAILPLWSLAYRGANRLLGLRVLTLEQRLLDYAGLLARHLRIPEYLSALLAKLAGDMGVTRSLFLLRNRAGSGFDVAASHPADSPRPGFLRSGSALATLLSAKPRHLDSEELLSAFDEDVVDGMDGAQRQALLADLQAYGAKVALPILQDGRVEGFLLLGSRVSEAIYSQAELDFLQALCLQVATALENSHLQEQVQQADRLSTLGTLSASVAHELRNPLTSISTFVQMFPDRHQDEGYREKFMRIVGAEVSKLQKLTEQLLSFAKPVSSSRGHVDLKQMAERVRQLLKHQFAKAGVKIELEASAQEATTVGNETELSQVLINLLLNGLQATPEGGMVSVSFGSDAKEAWFEVKDTGVGMNPDQAKRIFEPFFTTKEEGTGLGLPACQRLVEQHQGRISLESREGEGSRFTVHLPKASAQSAPMAA